MLSFLFFAFIINKQFPYLLICNFMNCIIKFSLDYATPDAVYYASFCVA